MAATYTPNYNLAQFLAYTVYDPMDESRRWTAIDMNLGAIAELVGDGVVDGWDVATLGSLQVSISAGNGFINKWAASSDVTETLNIDANSAVYVIAQTTADSYYTGEVTFSTIDDPTSVTCVILAYVITDASSITSIDTSVKQICGFSASIQAELTNILNSHLHDGIDAPKIDLSTMVTGLLLSDNIGQIPYSKISGNILSSLIGSISHNDLTHKGHWTHPEIDTFIDAVATYDYNSMGDIVLANHLQNSITNMYLVPTTAQLNHINQRVIIPGLTTNYYEATYTTALINSGTYQAQGTYAATHAAINFSLKYETSESESVGYLYPNRIGTISNITPYDNAAYLTRTASAPNYAISGDCFYIHNENTGNPLTNWKSLTWTNDVPNSASIWVSYQTKHEAENWNLSAYTNDTGETTVDLTPLNSAEELSLKFHLYAPTTNITPKLQTAQLTWDTSTDLIYGYKFNNTKENLYDFMTPTLSNNYINLEDISGAVTLQKLKNYNTTGYFVSTTLDGTSSFLVWDKLYTDTLSNNDINWYARTATDSGYFATYPNDSWNSLSQIDGGVYDLSPFRYQYLQLQTNLTGNIGYTPEILSFYVTRFDKVATNVGTSIAYKRWTADTTGNVGFMSEGSAFTNIATSEFVGGLSIADPNAGIGLYRSTPYKPEASSIWSNVKIYGEGFETQNININIYLSDKPDYSYVYVGCYIPTTSPHTVDLTSVNSLYRKDYLYYEITFKD